MIPAEYDVKGKVVFITGGPRIARASRCLADPGGHRAHALPPKYSSRRAAIARATGRRVFP